jgi:hypothetical protein
MDMPAPGPTPLPVAARAPVPVFETRVPTEILPPLAPYELPAVAESEHELDPSVWMIADENPSYLLAGEPLHEDTDAWLAEIMSAPPPDGISTPVNGLEVLAPASASDAPLAATGDAAGEGGDPFDPFLPAWAAVRDANIRPYADWRPTPVISLPVLQVRPQPQQPQGHGQPGPHGRHPQHAQQDQRRQRAQSGNGGGNDRGGNDRGGNDRGGRNKRKRRGNDRQNNRPNRDRDRDRGPRIPGVYNPGGD